jgi:GT2 family glycosyltransferase
MKIAIIFLDYLRHEYTKQTLRTIANAGYPFDLYTVDMKGIASAINHGLDITKQYDAVAICGNDIEMPDNWLLKMIDHAQKIPMSGMIGIHCVEHVGNPIVVNDVYINHSGMVSFGNVLLTRQAIDAVGYFNTDYDPYGMQDSDYGYRLQMSGFINYYITGVISQHIGHDVGQQTAYRMMKDDGLKLCDKKWLHWTTIYDNTKNYKIETNPISTPIYL